MLSLLTAGSSLAAFVGQPFGTSTLSHSRTAPQAAVMMAGMPLPAGSLVALATPMKENGDVDIPTLRKVLQFSFAPPHGVVRYAQTGATGHRLNTYDGDATKMEEEKELYQEQKKLKKDIFAEFAAKKEQSKQDKTKGPADKGPKKKIAKASKKAAAAK